MKGAEPRKKIMKDRDTYSCRLAPLQHEPATRRETTGAAKWVNRASKHQNKQLSVSTPPGLEL